MIQEGRKVQSNIRKIGFITSPELSYQGKEYMQVEWEHGERVSKELEPALLTEIEKRIREESQGA